MMSSKNIQNNDNSISIILSTYNEASVIEDTLTKIFKTIEGGEIVLVDDNSNLDIVSLLMFLASIILIELIFFFKIFDKCVLPEPFGPYILTHFPSQLGQLSIKR